MGESIQKASLPDEIFDVIPQIPIPSMNKEEIDLKRTLDQIEKKILSNALVQADGIINKAAKNWTSVLDPCDT